MKKIFVSLLVMIMTAASVFSAACGSVGKRKIPGWVEGKKNVVYYTWGSTTEIDLLEEIVAAFEAEHEDINVIVSQAGKDYYSDLEYQIAGTQTPDIVNMKPGYIQPYLRNNTLVSLDNYIKNSDKITADMIWDINNAYRYDKASATIGTGEIYSLIKDFSPDFILSYDKKDVRECAAKLESLDYPKQAGTNYPSETEPMTWSQFKAFAEALQTSGRMGTHLDNEPWQQLLQWIQQSGASLFSEDDKTVVDIKNTPAVREAFEYYRELRDECVGNTPVAKNSSVQSGGAQLKENQAASVFLGRWASINFGWDKSTAVEVGYAPTPVPDGLEVTSDTKYNGITAMVGMSISAKSEFKDEAWQFIEFYYTEGSKSLAQMGYNIPGNKVMAENYFCGAAEDAVIDAKVKTANELFYDYATNNTFVIKFNRYMTQATVEKQLSKNFSAYLADSKDKAFNNDNWEKTLDAIRADLQRELDKAVKAAS